MSLDLIVFILYANVALAGLTVLVYFAGRPEREFTPAEVARVKWFLIALLVWVLMVRGLGTEVSHSCVFSISALGRNWLSTFLACSPKLLSDGPVAILLFFWAWAPFLLIPAIFAYHLLHMARRLRRVPKES